MRTGILIVATSLLTSCASQKDVAINAGHDAMLTAHAQAQSEAAQAKAYSIGNSSNIECRDDMTAGECALAKVLAVVVSGREIASIRMEQFRSERPKTGVDAQIAVAKEVGDGVPVVTMGVVSYKAIADDGGTVNNTNNGRGNTLTNTREEDHATAISEAGSDARNKSEESNEDDNSIETTEETE